MILFKPIHEPITVDVNSEDLRKLLTVELGTDGKLSSINWVEGSNKGEFLLTYFRNAVPSQLII